MIVFIAPYPSEENQKDGMVQRIASIDALVATEDRCYLDISFRRHWKKSVKHEDLVSIHRLNGLLHLLFIYRLIRKSRAVYIHSVFNALKIIPFLFRPGNILDAHGIVPEELEQERRPLAACIYGLIERFALRGSSVIVCVSESMRRHFKHKYGRDSNADLIIPILPTLGEASDNGSADAAIRRSNRSVIYAGGLQAWQNIDKMLAAAAQMPGFSYTFLTGEVGKLEEELQSYNVQNFVCKSVNPDQVKAYYLDNGFGFILREPILVNAVACPTKLIEYIYWGVIPVVITPSIGDFDDSNLFAITLQDFLNEKIPSTEAAEEMRNKNRATIDSMITAAAANRIALQRHLKLGFGSSP